MRLTRWKSSVPMAVLLLGAACLPALAQAPAPRPDEAATRAFRLTSAERQQAVALAERELKARSLATASPIFLVDTDLLRDKADEKGQRRLALITHFRYEGNLAIETLVDLAGGKVLQVESRENLGAPLAPAELEAAIAMTLADPQVRAALGRDAENVTVEGLHLLTSDPKDPLYGHRAVRMLFRVGTLYRSAPVVIADLTTRGVTIEAPRQAADHSADQH